MKTPARTGQEPQLPSMIAGCELGGMGSPQAMLDGTDRSLDSGLTGAPLAELVGDLATKHGLSLDRAQMLVDRFGVGRRSLDGAAMELHRWK